jgi:hypothetical protein
MQHTNEHNVEMESPFQQFLFCLLGNCIESNIGTGNYLQNLLGNL